MTRGRHANPLVGFPARTPPSAVTGQRPYLVYGGTRLTNSPTRVARPGFKDGFTSPAARRATPEYVRKLGNDLRAFGVRKLAATHCTGAQSEAILAHAFGDDFITQTLGMTITLPPLKTGKRPATKR